MLFENPGAVALLFKNPGAVALIEFCEQSEQNSSIYIYVYISRVIDGFALLLDTIWIDQ